jgi:hypothetical protein
MASPWDEFKGMSRKELDEYCKKAPLLENHAHDIEDQSDFSFKALDGRVFALFFYSEKIKYKLLAKDIYISAEEKKTLDGISGFILEVGTSEPPFIFSKSEDLYREWRNHHEMFSVPLSQDEIDSELFGDNDDSEDKED